MPYDDIPRVKATYLDGAFKTNPASTQPRILVVGAGSSGRTYEVFNVVGTGEAEAEFGVDSEVMKGVHEALAQGGDNISVMRIGGHQGSTVVTETTTGETLTFVPESRDDEILERFSLIIVEDPTNVNRIIVYDLEAEEYVFDTLEELCINGETIRVIDTGIDTYTVGDILDPAGSPTLAALVTGSFTATGSGTIASVTVTAGTDGTSMSLPERYAALNQAYHILDFRDADIVIPQAVHLDDPNQSDGSVAIYDTGVPTMGSSGDVLGLVWQYIYQGKLYTYMVEAAATLAAFATKQFGGTTVGRVTFTALAAGPLGEAVKIKFTTGAVAGSEVVTISGSTVTIQISNGVSTAAQIKTAYDATTADTTLASIVATVAGAVTIPGSQLATAVALDLAGALTHLDLTGDSIPAAVATRWTEAVSAEFRECNFAHQLASFCLKASTNWKTMIGLIPTLGPAAYDRLSIAEWVGTLPTFTLKGLDQAIDVAGDNGTGLLGNKFLAGQAGYRDEQVTEGDSGDGYAFGGLILTVGASLPNGTSHAYGILESDEAVDSGGRPVDIGKFIIVTYDRPKHRNAFNGGSTYRGGLANSLAGKIAITPPNRDPIGDGGQMVKIVDTPRVHAVQINDLIKIRMAGMRKEDGVGLILVDVKTAAHPDSDYTLLSTIRCVNREIQGLRQIAKRYIGKSFTPDRIVALHSALESFLFVEKGFGFNAGAKISLNYTRADKILGRLKIKLRMIPPFSIKFIEVETSLAADESEL